MGVSGAQEVFSAGLSAADAHSPWATVNSEDCTNNGKVEVTNVDSGKAPLQACEKTSTDSGLPPIWMAAANDST
jgi:hypothetical protein